MSSEIDANADKKVSKRVLKANNRAFNKEFNYANNFIKTSKYNVITFVPKNLFEQFQRLANFYFLLLMALQFVSVISSITWYSTAIPLAIVLAFSGVKDAYDDIQRHRADSQVNNRICMVVRNNSLIEEKWMNVRVGDVIRMQNEDFIASDLLILSTSEPYGICYVETAELDGETNLKSRAALPETALYGDTLKDISAFDGEIICELPNNRLDKFDGNLILKNESHPIDNNRMLLRGCRMRNTRWCYGVVVFAGIDTKLMMNSGKTKFKRTSLDKFLNFLIMGIVLFLIAMCLICTILCGVWEWTTGKNFQEYLLWDKRVVPDSSEKSGKQIALIAFLMFFSYVILLNTVVPISLYVSVEILRFIHSKWIDCDKEIYDAKNDVPAKARTTTLNEELGQVQYIFSDKTGTLTQNLMTFNKCSINGRSYGDIMNHLGQTIEKNSETPCVDFSFNTWYEKTFEFYDKSLLDDTLGGRKEVDEFWKILAICHTIMPERKAGNKLEYQAQSPDEAALTSAARNFGYVFKSRTPQSITIEINGKDEYFQVLQFLDFNNFRKRMSVIIIDSSGKIKLYCKGADTMVMERISPNTSSLLKDATIQHLDKFASDGLRTLCLAYKELDKTACYEWLDRVKIASQDLENRDEKVDMLYEELEVNMTLIGATAIEDKLQDDVPATISKLAAANIKIWVLTGDKTETAINIGFSCKLLTDSMKDIMIIDGKTDSEVEIQLKDSKRIIDRGSGKKGSSNPSSPLQQNQFPVSNARPTEEEDEEGREGFALVVNGDSLVFALTPRLEKLFLDIGCACQTVICCRVTPLQKAQVVDLVKRNKKAVTLAVGDGANDVSMIKTAHIGVGISGKEGMQAVLASDYSIGQFRFLQRLLLVHGRWSYFRMCKFLRYFFYKNFSFTLVHFWYSFFCGYSAMPIYDPVMISCYNMFFTALPCLAMGVLDQDVDDDYSLLFPKLYIPGQYNLFFNMRIFIYSVLHGIISSLVIFFVPYAALYKGTNSAGQDLNDYAMLSFTVFTGLIIVVTGQIMMDTSYWTPINHFCNWGSIALYFTVVFIYYEALPATLSIAAGSSASYGVPFRAMSTPHFWFSILLISVILLLPVLVSRFFWIDTHPSYSDKIKAHKKLYNIKPLSADVEKNNLGMLDQGRAIPRTVATRRSRRGSLRSGYAFSHSSGFGDLISKGKLFKLDNLRRNSLNKKELALPKTPGPVGNLESIEEGAGPSKKGSSKLRRPSKSRKNVASVNVVDGETVTKTSHNIWINEDADRDHYYNEGYEDEDMSPPETNRSNISGFKHSTEFPPDRETPIPKVDILEISHEPQDLVRSTDFPVTSAQIRNRRDVNNRESSNSKTSMGDNQRETIV
uniref:Phospholipid-transporting ATPase n=1 Tax=Rhabditophanes sp. KR3021 TaxID=114890 RepID=A0AC35TXU4_9BILA